jgi:hypothetical protein
MLAACVYLKTAKLATMKPMLSQVTSLTQLTASAKFWNRPLS